MATPLIMLFILDQGGQNLMSKKKRFEWWIVVIKTGLPWRANAWSFGCEIDVSFKLRVVMARLGVLKSVCGLFSLLSKMSHLLCLEDSGYFFIPHHCVKALILTNQTCHLSLLQEAAVFDDKTRWEELGTARDGEKERKRRWSSDPSSITERDEDYLSNVLLGGKEKIEEDGRRLMKKREGGGEETDERLTDWPAGGLADWQHANSLRERKRERRK